jgi:zinc-binding alcohol dehydrogenase/oxidoreductase
MKAIVFRKPGGAAHLEEYEKPHPQSGQVRVRVLAASLNRRDFWIKKGIYKNSQYPCIPGSDASGIVDAVGDMVDKSHLGREVIINPAIGWGENEAYHSTDFQILGLPMPGTLAEYVCVPLINIWPKPPGWSYEKAAALPLAGLTAYRALFTRGKVMKGENVLITGIGGGVAVVLLKFARAAGANVFVSSSSLKKIKKAIQLGATAGVLYTKKDWEEQLATMVEHGFDLIVDSAAGKNFPQLLSLLRLGGRIVNFGGTAGPIKELTAASLFWKQASILGTTMGSNKDFQEMLQLVSQNTLEPEIDKIFPMEDCEIAFKHMENHEQFGKIVIKINNE